MAKKDGAICEVKKTPTNSEQNTEATVSDFLVRRTRKEAATTSMSVEAKLS